MSATGFNIMRRRLAKAKENSVVQDTPVETQETKTEVSDAEIKTKKTRKRK